ncbi:MAG TPA: hypothetical protein PLS53_08225 [Thermoanaerobaculaceae bacterium]|nr:hypothetical protein [Thermoanaerobaculaceae bacterium]HPS78125.1 hypothetical protein [Thermoanaerobaculaceae bacterium]
MGATRWPRPWHLLFLLPLVGVAVWLGWRAQRVREDPAHILLALRAVAGPTLPAELRAGATRRTPLQSYDKETLYEFIDGAAEAYLANGFERCTATVYAFADGAAELEVAAEAYRFGGTTGARTQMTSERPTDAAAVPGLIDTFADPSSLLAVHNRDFLKLTAMGSGPAAEAALRRVAAAWLAEQP